MQNCFAYYILNGKQLAKECDFFVCLSILEATRKKATDTAIVYGAMLLIASLSGIVSKNMFLLILAVISVVSGVHTSILGLRKPYSLTVDVGIVSAEDCKEFIVLKSYNRMDLLPKQEAHLRIWKAALYGIVGLLLGLLAAPLIILCRFVKAVRQRARLGELIFLYSIPVYYVTTQ